MATKTKTDQKPETFQFVKASDIVGKLNYVKHPNSDTIEHCAISVIVLDKKHGIKEALIERVGDTYLYGTLDGVRLKSVIGILSVLKEVSQTQIQK